MAHFVGSDTRGTRIAAVVDFLRKVERLVQRVVMVRKEPVVHQHLHVGNPGIHKDGLRHVGTGKPAGNVHFLARGKAGLDQHGNTARKGERHQKNHHV